MRPVARRNRVPGVPDQRSGLPAVRQAGQSQAAAAKAFARTVSVTWGWRRRPRPHPARAGARQRATTVGGYTLRDRECVGENARGAADLYFQRVPDAERRRRTDQVDLSPGSSR